MKCKPQGTNLRATLSEKVSRLPISSRNRNLKSTWTVSALIRQALSTKSQTIMVACHYSVRPSENEKTMSVIQPGRYALLLALSIGVLAATISEGSQGNTTVPVFVHRRTGSKPCELVQRGSLVTAKEFAWVEIEGEKSETYSPEMGPGDYLSISPPVSERVAKDARKSGFEIKGESTIDSDPPNVLALVRDADCPSLASAISEVEQARALRRTALQARAYKPGNDDVIAALTLNENKSASTSDQSSVLSLLYFQWLDSK